MRKALLKTDIDARILYTLTPNDGGTFVLRELDLLMNLPTLYKLASPFILVRTLACLKRYVELSLIHI